jgi:hypothetical protein
MQLSPIAARRRAWHSINLVLAALFNPADDRRHCLCCDFGFPSVMFTTLYLTGHQAALTTAAGLFAALRAVDLLAAHAKGAGWTR